LIFPASPEFWFGSRFTKTFTNGVNTGIEVECFLSHHRNDGKHGKMRRHYSANGGAANVRKMCLFWVLIGVGIEPVVKTAANYREAHLDVDFPDELVDEEACVQMAIELGL